MYKMCTLSRTMEYVAKRWTVLILVELWKDEDNEWKRFCEIREAMRDITPKVLSERLKELESEGLIEKRVDSSQFPIKSEYALTPAGLELVEFIQQIKYWALKWKIMDPVCMAQDCRCCKL
ncbi:HxlR-like helix-turn-helix [Candidatus Methanoplasma termitum]|uniref:HxlR-like helix-turn-helix n=1 Tax=Candidatus Methanoplasma termitum TaxID=1577791 RepID=A0A0A7LDH2_9ARCH|nr:helix-turn-helix domain-containing protein [Candidatus Methanoplasma termitum]AIZ57043.1 HxlR-like helix-turn-helix [Candidatus Methanoplasma termitum]MCL2334029.1 helix-turn-helix transcriptional regulator [Candidatus Methanoplasma sp.]